MPNGKPDPACKYCKGTGRVITFTTSGTSSYRTCYCVLKPHFDKKGLERLKLLTDARRKEYYQETIRDDNNIGNDKTG